ncbi:MAG: L,D-transpeptidase family protein [Verrucomicrobiota bacterium]
MKRLLFLLTLFLAVGFNLPLGAQEISKKTKQLLTGVSANWNSSYVTLTLYERGIAGGWKQKGASWSGRLGRNGLAWGRGMHEQPALRPGVAVKKEGDGRAPAGIFYIGHGAWGYASSIKKKAGLPYTQITTRSLWYEDASSPYYNQPRVLGYEPRSTAEKKAQMKQGDYAHSLKLFIGHNAAPNAVPGYGSAIFFHIWRRDGAAATAGCTTMSESNLKNLISQIDPNQRPVYVLLPKEEYAVFKPIWKLP